MLMFRKIKLARRRAVAWLLMLAMLLASFPAVAVAKDDNYAVSALMQGGTSAQSAILIEADTGRVIYSQNANARLPMASTTKIMTALVAIENMPLDTVVSIPREAVGVEGSSVYLYDGEEMTLEELLYAVMLASANDAATAVAITVGGSVEGFADLMNQKAQELGLKDTHFTNPHGLDDKEHYTTAAELAKISACAMENEVFARIASTDKKIVPMRNSSEVRVLVNHNKMLHLYDGAVGIKTGFTKKSGRCLVTSAERDGLRLIAVTLNAPNDWQDHTLMLDYGFSLYESVTLCDDGDYRSPLLLQSGEQEYVMVTNTESLVCSLPKVRGEISCTVELPRFEFAPITAGEEVGRLVYYLTDASGERSFLGSVPLIAEYSVSALTYELSLWERILDFFS